MNQTTKLDRLFTWFSATYPGWEFQLQYKPNGIKLRVWKNTTMDQEFEDALAAYNHEPYADVSILMINPTPFKKRIIINIDIKDYEKQPKVIPYI